MNVYQRGIDHDHRRLPDDETKIGRLTASDTPALLTAEVVFNDFYHLRSIVLGFSHFPVEQKKYHRPSPSRAQALEGGMQSPHTHKAAWTLERLNDENACARCRLFV